MKNLDLVNYNEQITNSNIESNKNSEKLNKYKRKSKCHSSASRGNSMNNTIKKEIAEDNQINILDTQENININKILEILNQIQIEIDAKNLLNNSIDKDLIFNNERQYKIKDQGGILVSKLEQKLIKLQNEQEKLKQLIDQTEKKILKESSNINNNKEKIRKKEDEILYISANNQYLIKEKSSLGLDKEKIEEEIVNTISLRETSEEIMLCLLSQAKDKNFSVKVEGLEATLRKKDATLCRNLLRSFSSFSPNKLKNEKMLSDSKVYDEEFDEKFNTMQGFMKKRTIEDNECNFISDDFIYLVEVNKQFLLENTGYIKDLMSHLKEWDKNYIMESIEELFFSWMKSSLEQGDFNFINKLSSIADQTNIREFIFKFTVDYTRWVILDFNVHEQLNYISNIIPKKQSDIDLEININNKQILKLEQDIDSLRIKINKSEENIIWLNATYFGEEDSEYVTKGSNLLTLLEKINIKINLIEIDINEKKNELNSKIKSLEDIYRDLIQIKQNNKNEVFSLKLKYKQLVNLTNNEISDQRKLKNSSPLSYLSDEILDLNEIPVREDYIEPIINEQRIISNHKSQSQNFNSKPIEIKSDETNIINNKVATKVENEKSIVNPKEANYSSIETSKNLNLTHLSEKRTADKIVLSIENKIGRILENKSRITKVQSIITKNEMLLKNHNKTNLNNKEINKQKSKLLDECQIQDQTQTKVLAHIQNQIQFQVKSGISIKNETNFSLITTQPLVKQINQDIENNSKQGGELIENPNEEIIMMPNKLNKLKFNTLDVKILENKIQNDEYFSKLNNSNFNIKQNSYNNMNKFASINYNSSASPFYSTFSEEFKPKNLDRAKKLKDKLNSISSLDSLNLKAINNVSNFIEKTRNHSSHSNKLEKNRKSKSKSKSTYLNSLNNSIISQKKVLGKNYDIIKYKRNYSFNQKKLSKEKYENNLLDGIKNNPIIKKMNNGVTCFFRKKNNKSSVLDIIKLNKDIYDKLSNYDEIHSLKKHDISNLIAFSSEEEIRNFHLKINQVHPMVDVLQSEGFSRCFLSLGMKKKSFKFFQKYTNKFLFLEAANLKKSVISLDIKNSITIHQIQKKVTFNLQNFIKENAFKEIEDFLLDYYFTLKPIQNVDSMKTTQANIKRNNRENKENEIKLIIDSSNYNKEYFLSRLNLKIFNFTMVFDDIDIDVIVCSYEDLKIWLNGIALIVNQ